MDRGPGTDPKTIDEGRGQVKLMAKVKVVWNNCCAVRYEYESIPDVNKK